MELDKIKSGQEKFTWGTVVKIHEIGDIGIVEYVPEQRSYDKNLFYIFVNGESQQQSWKCLDSAIIAAVARKYEGLNSSAAAANYICKMISMPGF